jgi:KaiC/GvpD/RAD55 family RecA-like ATPase
LETFLNSLYDNIIVCELLLKDEITPLMEKVHKLKQKYNWMSTVEIYKKVYNLISKTQDLLKKTELLEEIGFSFYRAAFQAKTSEDFRKLIDQSIKSYEKSIELLSTVYKRKTKTELKKAKAMKAYLRSWLEQDTEKMTALLDEWWKLEKEALKDYELAGNLLEIGKICNDLLEFSFKNRFHLITDWSAIIKAAKEYMSLGEKAIKALSTLNDDKELARAYCWTSWYYSFSAWFRVSEKQIGEYRKKSMQYSKKAVALSEKTCDSWLIGWSLHAAGFSAIVTGGKKPYKFSKKARKTSIITKDKHLMAETSMWASKRASFWAILEEDPDKLREGLKEAAKWAKKALEYYRIIQNPCTVVQIHSSYVDILRQLAMLETDKKTKRNLLEKAVNVGKEFFKQNCCEITVAVHSLSIALYTLSKIIPNEEKKKSLLKEALDYRLQYTSYLEETVPLAHLNKSSSYVFLAYIKSELAKIETESKEKIRLYNNAVLAMESSVDLAEKEIKKGPIGWKGGLIGKIYFSFGEILRQLFELTKEKKTLTRTIEVFRRATKLFSHAQLATRVAESNWRIAKVYEQIEEHDKASKNYFTAAKAYKLAGQKIPQLKDFFNDHSLYMQAWSQIEQAKHCHKIENYDEAKSHFEKAAQLQESTSLWNYIAVNYFAWAKFEEAESLSRKEKPEEAIQKFQLALEKFQKTKEVIKKKIKEITESEEKETVYKLIKASNLRRKYCLVRINIENAKILDKNGNYSQSSRSYSTAAESLQGIINELQTKEEQRELKMVMMLCRAWYKLALAEETVSQKAYLEASKLFEQIKKYSYNKKTTLLILGNSSFCKGLAAETQFQITLKNTDRLVAKRNIEKAATLYLRAGLPNASEYAKATLRLIDAYQYMSDAETEIDPKERAKKYNLAEKFLEFSAISFIKSNQPEKIAQVQVLLNRVKEEKSIATSLNEVLHAPEITSSTTSFSSPSPTREESVGLEKFEHANIQANLISSINEVKVGESFNITIEFVNTGREPALLTVVDDFIPAEFTVVDKPDIYRIENNALNLKGKPLKPLEVLEVALILQPSKKGTYYSKPKICYLDEFGNEKLFTFKSITIKVEEVILPNRISTGTKELDSLLLGGIPEGYAVALTGPPSDERDLLIERFLQNGVKKQEKVFHLTTQTDYFYLAKNFQSKFYLFLCNPTPKPQVSDQANIIKLKSRTDLNNLNIALARAYRTIEKSSKSNKIACVDIISDILLHYSVETTRRWILQLITDLNTKGFTLLAVFNSQMHPIDQANAILDLFDGEINLFETKDRLRCKRSLRIIKMRKQEYIENPICLTKPLHKKQQ